MTALLSPIARGKGLISKPPLKPSSRCKAPSQTHTHAHTKSFVGCHPVLIFEWLMIQPIRLIWRICFLSTPLSFAVFRRLIYWPQVSIRLSWPFNVGFAFSVPIELLSFSMLTNPNIKATPAQVMSTAFPMNWWWTFLQNTKNVFLMYSSHVLFAAVRVQVWGCQTDKSATRQAVSTSVTHPQSLIHRQDVAWDASVGGVSERPRYLTVCVGFCLRVCLSICLWINRSVNGGMSKNGTCCEF